MEPLTRTELFLAKAAGQDVALSEPVTRVEKFLAAAAGQEVALPEPVTRVEQFLSAVVEKVASGGSGGGATEPYVEWTVDEEGYITEAALFGFTVVPERMFFNTRATSGGYIKLKKVDFSGCPNLTRIDAYAFYSCNELETLELPNGITTIGDNAFNSCSKLVLTSLPESLEYIGDSAFAYCKAIEHLEIKAKALGEYTENDGSYVVTGGTKIFNNCTGLKTVWIRSTCDRIYAASAANAPFVGCATDLAIYAEDSEKQLNWGDYFNCTGSAGGTTVTVTYGQTTCPW